MEKKVSYDEKNDTLFITRGIPTYSSSDIEDFIIDFDKKGSVVAVEIEDASVNLRVKKELLKDITSIDLTATYSANMIKIFLKFRFKDSEKEILIPLGINNIQKKAGIEKVSFAIS